MNIILQSIKIPIENLDENQQGEKLTIKFSENLKKMELNSKTLE
jgi:uncharacterized protein YpbB|tara:strand:- start:474 stop:605 length:132 start_codon:yes stop_codon:yes gene_type:complete